MYTDGACSGNQNEKNTGGWGCVLEFGEYGKELHGGEPDTTNNRMELSAVIQGFRALTRDSLTIEVFTDSSYLAECFRQKWYENWRRNGWRTSKKTPVENRDLWEELLSRIEKNDVTFYRVKGHVNLGSPSADTDALYRRFREWNGDGFSFDDFRKVTEMNNRADELAQQGIDEQKGDRK